jgi:predicted permease
MDRSAFVSFDNADPAFINDATKFFGELFRDPSHTGNADYVVASEGYFQALGIPLLTGRLFNSSDGPDAPQVALISDSVARRQWPNQDAIGHTIEFGNMDGDLRPLTIVGVVGEVRARSLEVPPRPTVYVNYRQRPRGTNLFNVVLRTNSEPAAVISAAQNILAQLDPTVPPRFNTFTEIFSESLSSRRFNLLLMGVFGLTALLLAMAGVFGVLAYSVAQRTREIGVRMALGASTGNVLRLILKQAVVTALVGIGIGLVTAIVLTGTMSSLLFEVSPTDPLTIMGVALLMVIVALLASYIPARRATRVDPMIALRYE